ncbi:unnamed protein product [Rotaria sordida]|uniref:F-box domain-containing protein n=1 Tax=Rotaria sordida TaxID=392033 RepID=A0A819KKE2_9BILA|nr:unnamed protein product [Rotaria sordida]CAF3807386.1 unnamed protein product [Rotaria sordida]CAF3946864.1 unnamed protein product [Rotaria sordida]
MSNSCVGLNDLPDEILMIIFKKLNTIDVLYSLHGSNQRLHKIVYDPIFTSCLTFVKRFSHNFINLICSDMMLNRFCSQILPEIHDKIKWLNLESSSMKHVLCTADYPNLYGLGLYNIDEESIRCLFTDEKLSSNIFKNQIRTLFITIDNNKETTLTVVNICDYILTGFANLLYLKLYESSYKNRLRLLFDDPPPPTFHSSTLQKLNIKIQCFDDCLYFLDGRFNQLNTLFVDLLSIRLPEEIHNQSDLPNLKCFSLSCDYETNYYDELILPLLYRMSNLEQLEAKQVLCHIYSYSSPMQYYSYITNNFPDGLFKYVRVVSLFDEHPFEHEFFLRIQKSFPFMERLCVINHKSQNHKQSYESNNDNRISSVIEYSFLSELDIDDVHDDYIEQFLFDTKTYLQSNVLLYINYESLKRLTHNFKRDATRINCAKVNELKFRSGAKCPNSSLQEYFPNAKIYYRGIF